MFQPPPDGLLALGIREISLDVANAVIQDVFGVFYGPGVDQFYGVRMAIALDLIDLNEHHCDKTKIDTDDVNPEYVRGSLLTWLPPEEWKDFHKLMVSTAQMIVESPDAKQDRVIRKITKKKFGAADKTIVLGMIDSIDDYFAVADE